MHNKRKHIFQTVINMVVPIILGACIYILARPDTYISQLVYRLWNIPAPSDTFRALLPNWIWVFFCNFAADILWAYSLTFAIYIVFCNSSINMLFVFAICVVFETGMELLQLFGILSGTFDWWDIAFEICASAIASLKIKHTRRKSNESFQ